MAREIGLPGLMQAMGGVLFDSQLEQRKGALEASYDAWFREVTGTLARISIARPKLPITGESFKLLKRLDSAGSAAKLDVRIRRVLALLGSLAQTELLWNEEIPRYLSRIAAREDEHRRAILEAKLLDMSRPAPGFQPMMLVNREAIRARLRKHPDVLETIEAVFNAALRDGPDDKRSALASCRVALESLGRKVTAQSDWRETVRKIADDDVQASFRKTYSLLSAKGSHGMKKPSAADVQLGVHLTLGCVFWLLEHESELMGSGH